jgi:lipopolysaccharide assembly outer membrane protein LptD (OstA)
MRTEARALAIVAILLAAVPRAYAQSGVEIEAGQISYQKAGTVLQATGGVQARWDGQSLTADSVLYERDVGRLSADGGLRLETPAVLLEASECELYIEEETGRLRDVAVEVKDSSSHFGGRVVDKLPGLRFKLKDGFFTTCKMEEGRSPDWSVTGQRSEVQVDGYGRVRGAALRVRGVPVLYFPYLVFPAITRRQSGLLMPRVGASDQRGFVYSQPYFWAIDKHQDLTVTADIETAERLGLGLDYRYRPSARTAGAAELHYYNEAIRGDNGTAVKSPLFQLKPGEHIPENRAVFTLGHRQWIGSNRELYADALIVSDDLVLRETDAVDSGFLAREPRRTRRYTGSRLGLLSTVDDPDLGFATYALRGSYFQDLVGPDRFTLQQPARLWSSADGDLPGNFGWVIDSEFGAFHRTESMHGQRLDMAATLERPLLTGRGPFRASTWARGRLTGYHNDNPNFLDLAPPDPEEPPEEPDDDVVNGVGEFLARLDPYAGRAVGEAGIDLRTGFVRAYELQSGQPKEPPQAPAALPPALPSPGELPVSALDDRSGWSGSRTDDLGFPLRSTRASAPGIWGEGGMVRRFSAIHHTIEPFSGLRFTTGSSERDLPLYDATDRIDDRTTATYGVASRFLFTEASSGRTSELANMSLAQTYNLEEEVVDDHFSDIDGTLGLVPTRDVSFSGLASYNVGTSSMRGAAAILTVDRLQLPLTGTRRSEIEAAYRFVRRGAVETAEEGLETVEARTILALTDRFAIGLNGRYDFVGNELVESGGGFRIESDCHCWTIDIGATNRVNPDETQFRIQVELAGLGSLGSSALSYRSIGLTGFDAIGPGVRRYGW